MGMATASVFLPLTSQCLWEVQFDETSLEVEGDVKAKDVDIQVTCMKSKVKP